MAAAVRTWLAETRRKASSTRELSIRASSSSRSTKPRICRDMVMMLPESCWRSVSGHSGACRSSASVRMTVRGVFNS